MDIKGICPIAPAVFDDHGNLDLTSYADCCRRLIALGAQALTLFGIAGEYYKLDADEERSSSTSPSAPATRKASPPSSRTRATPPRPPAAGPATSRPQAPTA